MRFSHKLAENVNTLNVNTQTTTEHNQPHTLQHTAQNQFTSYTKKKITL